MRVSQNDMWHIKMLFILCVTNIQKIGTHPVYTIIGNPLYNKNIAERNPENETQLLYHSKPYEQLRSEHDPSGLSDVSLMSWIDIVVMILCLTISFIFSALNLGLMSLSVYELQMLIISGTPEEQKYAKKILPIRKKGNYLLCSILLCLTLVNAIFTTVLDTITTSVVGVTITTITLVLLGEIIPQAVGSRHALAMGAKTIYLSRLAMILTFPLSYPLGKLLDWILGEEVGSIKTRENLKAFVEATSQQVALKKDEVKIISGALELSRKRVEHIMTVLADCYMLDINTTLNFDVIAEIVRTGYSRVPVYEHKRSNVVYVLFTKDLAVIDPDDNIPLRNVITFIPQEIYSVPVGTTLDVLLKNFKTGIKGHMAFVQQTDEYNKSKPRTVGLVTLEDVIEEIIQAEINDESDMYEDNRSARKRTHRKLMQDFMKYTETYGNRQVRVSPQLILVAYQYLSTSVLPFLPQHISPAVLWRMLQYDVYRHVKTNDEQEARILYTERKRADYFIVILEGRVTVRVGVEKLEYESGPFTCFGTQALLLRLNREGSLTNAAAGTSGTRENTKLDSRVSLTDSNTVFYPDYTITAKGEIYYLIINQDLYGAGLHATKIERSHGGIKAKPNERYKALYMTSSTPPPPPPSSPQSPNVRPVQSKNQTMQPVQSKNQTMQPVQSKNKTMQPVQSKNPTKQPVQSKNQTMQRPHSKQKK
ncbi:hypothetical protein M8J77_008550 [Diaphorina citri]|nr:hypothetical protein M8J77_008550 [Diaphorina citri]